MNHRRRRCGSRTVLTLLLAAGIGAAAQSAFGEGNITPLNGKEITVTVDGKGRTYYLLKTAEPMSVRVDGPVTLRILTRLSLSPDENGEVPYSIDVSEGATVVKVYSTTTALSNASFSGGNRTPAKSRKFSITVPEGSHTYLFRLEGKKSNEAALRFSTVATEGTDVHGKMTRIEPLSYDRVVTLSNKEKLITYYVCSLSKGVQLRVIGPTRVAIDARLNFDARMQGEQNYSVTVSEGLKPTAFAPFTSTKTLAASYEDWKEMVPGKLNKLTFDVPKGRHVYRIDLKGGPSVSMKFSIPEKDLGNSE